jgi:hypothetical protein
MVYAWVASRGCSRFVFGCGLLRCGLLRCGLLRLGLFKLGFYLIKPLALARIAFTAGAKTLLLSQAKWFK